MICGSLSLSLSLSLPLPDIYTTRLGIQVSDEIRLGMYYWYGFVRRWIGLRGYIVIYKNFQRW